MLSGHVMSLHEKSDSDELLLADPVSETDDEELSVKVLYRASFEELEKSHAQYDTTIWVLVSLLLVLAWGVGLLMLLYLPFRRYVLQKEISSSTLYVTQKKIVYKATRPSFLPFLGPVSIEKQVPLHLVIDIIIEQGWLQSIYGLHTFRIETIARGKAAPVDELQFQGVSNPELLRKVIITEAAKNIREVRSLRPASLSGEGLSTSTMKPLTEIPSLGRLQSPRGKARASSSSRHVLLDTGGIIPGDIVLHKLEEVSQSVKKLESLVVGSHS
ncbi:uncharacterized protein [Typha angustifolia]|uniref:uncharacterized protein n=1 Tax=Typha angustifolia TaxID=59011 RepID=UPI003C2CF8F6